MLHFVDLLEEEPAAGIAVVATEVEVGEVESAIVEEEEE